MTGIKERALKYLQKHSKYSPVFNQTFVAVDTLTAMVEFAQQEKSEKDKQIKELQQACTNQFEHCRGNKQ